MLGAAGAALDYYGFMFHGRAMTHLDALCHVWDADGMWNGRDPKTELDPSGATWADITAWSGGIITRRVLLDVPRHRGSPYVTVEAPVHGWELEAIAEAQGVAVGAGDAVLVYSGFEAYRDAQPDDFGREPFPGLHASCIAYVRDHDVALLSWDMLDSKPADYGLAWGVHGVIYSYGVALLDNALLAPLAAACAAEGRHGIPADGAAPAGRGRHREPRQPGRDVLAAREDLEPAGGFEPSTRCLRNSCSTTELHRRTATLPDGRSAVVALPNRAAVAMG